MMILLFLSMRNERIAEYNTSIAYISPVDKKSRAPDMGGDFDQVHKIPPRSCHFDDAISIFSADFQLSSHTL